MSLTSHLQLPSVEAFRRRTSSAPEGKDRYVVMGGFVRIEELSKSYEASKSKKFRPPKLLSGYVSPRSRHSAASSISEDVESQGWDSVPTSPYRSESWSSPQTPRTPFAGAKQSICTFDHYQTTDITPPPLSRYNRQGHDLFLDLSPRSSRLSTRKCHLFPQSIAAPSQDRTLPDRVPIELAGSLLLPSQGFSQSNPPQVPPHVNVRSHSAPVVSGVSPPLFMIPEVIKRSQTAQELEPDMAPSTPILATNLAEIKGQSRTPQPFHSTASLNSDNQSRLPMRRSSLRSKPTTPQYRPPPTPLSKMSLEELMDVLPHLDAAIIAQDWLPCMQIKHNNLKKLLEAAQHPVTGEVSSQPFDQVC